MIEPGTKISHRIGKMVIRGTVVKYDEVHDRVIYHATRAQISSSREVHVKEEHLCYGKLTDIRIIDVDK